MKTGTSSIQAALAGNPDILERAGMRYLGWPLRRPEDVEARLKDVAPDVGAIVVDEGWWHFARSRRLDLPAIAQLFREFDVTIVVYLRRPDQYVEAWFSQGLKRGTGGVRVADFLSAPFVNRVNSDASTPDAGPYDGLNLRILGTLNFLSRKFPDARIVVRPYERQSLIDNDVVHDFLDVVGLDPGSYRELVSAAEANVTQDGSDLLLVSLLRQRYGVPESLLGEVLNLPRRQDAARILTFEEASGINEALKPVFRTVQETWGGGVTDDFFADWTLDADTYRVSPLREVYDRALATTPE